MRVFPISTVLARRHSRLAGDYAILGGFTFIEGILVSPAISDSSISGGKSMDVTFTRSKILSFTIFMTNSFVFWILYPVSFKSFFLVSSFPIPIATIGGSSPIKLKNEKGAAFGIPLSLNVEMKAIGLGVIREINRLYLRCAFIVEISNSRVSML
jgi:hypothetical protein